jgi:hypothetical protein
MQVLINKTTNVVESCFDDNELLDLSVDVMKVIAATGEEVLLNVSSNDYLIVNTYAVAPDDELHKFIFVDGAFVRNES